MERSGGPLSGNLVEKLAREDRARLFALGRSRVLEPDAVLVRQGTPGDCLFVVEEGELAVVRSLPGDDEELLIAARRGMILGEMAVLDGGVRAASLRAVGRTVVRVIGVGAFEALALHGGEPGRRILHAVAAMMNERIDATCAQDDARCRPSGPFPAAGLEWSPAAAGTARWLAVLPSLAAFDDADREMLASRAMLAEMRRGEEFTVPGERASGVTMVLRGALCAWGDDGRAHETRPPVAPGGFVDYGFALGFGRATRCWRARSATTLVRLEADLFEAPSPCGARLMHALARDLAATLRRATSRSMHFEMAWAHEARHAMPLQRTVAQEA